MAVKEGGVFEPLIGHDGAKAILRSSLQRGDVHVLLSGPPASGKSVALLAIEEAIDGAQYVDGRGFSERKLRDTLADNPPVLLVDEFDNMKPDAFKALNTALEQGRVTKSVTGDDYDVAIDTQVFAACNYPEELPGDVQDRFVQVPFDPYTRGEYIDVCEVLLPRQIEWLTDTPNPDTAAREIARLVWDEIGAQSPRTARDAARLADSVERVPAIVKAMEDPKADVDSEPVHPEDLPHNNRDTDEDTGIQKPTSLDDVRESMADPDDLESRDVSEIDSLLGGDGDDGDDDNSTESGQTAASSPDPDTQTPGESADNTDAQPQDDAGESTTEDDGADEDEDLDLGLDVGYDSGREYIQQMLASDNRVVPASTEMTTVGLVFPEEFTEELVKLSKQWKLDPEAPDVLPHEPKTIRNEFGEAVSSDLRTIQFHASDPQDVRSTGYDIESIIDAIADESILITVSSTLRWQPDL